MTGNAILSLTTEAKVDTIWRTLTTDRDVSHSCISPGRFTHYRKLFTTVLNLPSEDGIPADGHIVATSSYLQTLPKPLSDASLVERHLSVTDVQTKEEGFMLTVDGSSTSKDVSEKDLSEFDGAYVHGIMDGEVISNSNRENWEIETINVLEFFSHV